MSTRDFTANVISATKVVPDGNFKDSKASGVWDINEALDLIKGGNWPNAANINPAAFVDALFQTHLYDGTGSNLEINNGINLSGSGGLVWVKRRNGGDGHWLVDTERGLNKSLQSHSTAANNTGSDQIVSFDSDGFTLGNRNEGQNYSGLPYVSWTWRKQPKFFDVVTYTGNGTAGRTVSHNLGTTVGMLIIKCTSHTSDWSVFHRSVGNDKYLAVNETHSAQTDTARFHSTTPSSTTFTLGSGNAVNGSGRTYVAYLFAHNNSDGGFGEPGDQDIIKCGSYTGNGSTQSISLGFEPQFIFLKSSSSASNWVILDNMRGVVTSSSAADDIYLFPNSATSEGGGIPMDFTATGFDLANEDTSNKSGDTFVYMAIRRGGMQTPTAASSVFDVKTNTSTNLQSGTELPATNIVTDFMLGGWRDGGYQPFAIPRMTEKHNYTGSTGAQGNSFFDFGHKQKQLKCTGNFESSTRSFIFWHWARARGYFDVVAYTGTGSGAQNVTHNLGVVPEMMWIKVRSDTDNWVVYHSALGNTKRLLLNGGDAVSSANSIFFNNTTPTSSVFTAGTIANASHTYIAYLFATVANVSKVGSFTQSGATNVDCGFTGDTPSFILLKRTDSTGNWYLFDSLRGIVTGNDPHTFINNSTTEVTNADVVDPYSGGFATTSSLTNGDYIFYAIAAIS